MPSPGVFTMPFSNGRRLATNPSKPILWVVDRHWELLDIHGPSKDMFSFLVHTSSFYSFPCPKFLSNHTWSRKTLKLVVRKQPLTVKPLSFIGSPSDAGGKGRLCVSHCLDKTQHFPLLLRFANSGLSLTNFWIFFLFLWVLWDVIWRAFFILLDGWFLETVNLSKSTSQPFGSDSSVALLPEIVYCEEIQAGRRQRRRVNTNSPIMTSHGRKS